MKRLPAAFLAALLSHVSLAIGQEPLVAPSELVGLEKAAQELAKAGRPDEWRTVLDVLARLGMEQRKAESLVKQGEVSLKRARGNARLTGAIKALATAIAALDEELATATGNRQRELANQLRRLDASLEQPNRVLGYERHDEVWQLAGAAERAMRKQEIAGAVAKASALEFEITVGQSDDAILTAALGRPGTVARVGRMEIHTSFGAVQTRRMLQQVLRAAAFANFLETGKVAVPDYVAQKNVLFRTPTQYAAAIKALQQQQPLPAADVDAALRPGMKSFRFMSLNPQLQYCCIPMEGDANAMWFSVLEYWRGSNPCLIAGRIDFTCRTILGQAMPRLAEIVTKERTASGRTTAGREEDQRLRESHLLLAPAGSRGAKAWMRYLAECGEAPTWSESMQQQVALIQGNELLKAGSMVEFLTEQGLLVGLDTLASEQSADSPAGKLSQALKIDLVQLEQQWRTWLMGLPDGVLQRLQAKDDDVSASTLAVLAELQQMRAHVGVKIAIEADAELQAGCALHAAYLKRHRDQAEKWPDCHEEHVDREGYSVAGAWAGRSSVVVSGVRSDQAAIASWMDTFYHRLPLLHPGLRRIGYVRDGDVAVLDAISMVDPLLNQYDIVVVWPYQGMQDAPNRFSPEMPNPVPGEDQSKFGYPITLQCTERSSGLPLDVRMVLRVGNERGKEVPCWWSSPSQPSNELLAPSNAFCLIPKAPLQKRKTYWVQAEFVGEDQRLEWTFKTK
jgi:hypothetical protein